MRFVADLHVHSRYSRATSGELDLEHLYYWAQLKGVTVVATGDFTHPQWFAELKEKLTPLASGLFTLKPEYAAPQDQAVPASCRAPVYFLLATEISGIYKQDGRVRKVHNLVLMPDFDSAAAFSARLATIGNVASDGRPILGLSSRNLLEIVLEQKNEAFLIPAHIWTPWFSALGSHSGFDSIDECFGDLTSHIFAVETGLSSDPPMNWRLSALDRFTLVSNSDAHSPAKLAREANIFDTELSFPAIRNALKTGDPAQYLGTIEFFPEEGKYHFDGHRKCNMRLTPRETARHSGLCPHCEKPVTVGVMSRVEELADRAEGEHPERTHPFRSYVALPGILGEVFAVGETSKKVMAAYHKLLARLGPELKILAEADEECAKLGLPLLTEALRRMRRGEIKIAAGYDGEYGEIKLFSPEDRVRFSRQKSMFTEAEESTGDKDVELSFFPLMEEKPKKRGRSRKPVPAAPVNAAPHPETLGAGVLAGLDEDQRRAASYRGGPQLIAAGPGTGKTRVLTRRIAHLVKDCGVAPESILAVTFTNRAAQEMSDRLAFLLPMEFARRLTVATFHGLGLQILKADGGLTGLKPPILVAGERDARGLLSQALNKLTAKPGARLAAKAGELIALAKQRLYLPPDWPDDLPAALDDLPLNWIYQAYTAELRQAGLLDYDDLILLTVKLWEDHPEALAAYRMRYRQVLVDEYQDLNQGQYRLLRLLMPDAGDLCVIGDPRQAIYRFRGADVKYFHTFQVDYPSAKLERLSRNYRSQGTVIAAANALWNGEDALQPLLPASHPATEAVLTDSGAEAEFIATAIEELVGGTSFLALDQGASRDANLGFGDIAVLFRLHSQADPIREALARHGLPYRDAGDKSWLHIPWVYEVVSYLRLSLHPESNLDLTRVLNGSAVNFPRVLTERLKENAAARGISLWEALLAAVEDPAWPGEEGERLAELAGRIGDLGVSVGRAAATDLLNRALGWIKREQPEEEEQQYAQRILQSYAASFGTRLADFLAWFTLLNDADALAFGGDKITLSTLHAAKGLEFPAVFIAGVEEGLLPYLKEGDNEEALAEEKRLFYVGLTRARERLTLTRAVERSLFGKELSGAPSRFLLPLAKELNQLIKLPPAKTPDSSPQEKQLALF